MEKRNLEVLNSFNILYLEDEPELLKHTSAVLEDFVDQVFPAITIKEALGILSTQKVDIILADINLKQESGIDFLKSIRHEMGYDMPAIFITAYTDTEYLLDAIKLKVDDYIVKPINVKELLNSMHDILLPKIQAEEIRRSNNMIRTISAISDGKQIEIIRFIIKNLDKNNMFNYSYGDIMESINVSKPTIIKLFKQLAKQGILTKLENKKYFFNENALPDPNKAEELI